MRKYVNSGTSVITPILEKEEVPVEKREPVVVTAGGVITPIAPGETFEAALDPNYEQQMLAGGHLAVVDGDEPDADASPDPSASVEHPAAPAVPGVPAQPPPPAQPPSKKFADVIGKAVDAEKKAGGKE